MRISMDDKRAGMPSAPTGPPQYLTFCPARSNSVRWKFHSTLGHAKNALIANYGEMYQWDAETETWKLLYTVEPRTRREAMPWKLEEQGLGSGQRGRPSF